MTEGHDQFCTFLGLIAFASAPSASAVVVLTYENRDLFIVRHFMYE